MNRSIITHIQTDFSRLVPGDWFIPVVWQGQDQHCLLAAAKSKGISGYMYSQELPASVAEELRELSGEYHPDLRQLVFDLAEERREQLSIYSVVITGSNGKTTVKEMLAAIVNEAYGPAAFMSPDNQNTKLALATQILRMPTQISHAVFEVGARRTGDFRIPLQILKPRCAVLLNLGTAHVGEFGSFENLRREKLSVLNCADLESVVVYGDDADMVRAAQIRGLPVVTFGKAVHNEVRVVHESCGFIRLYAKGQLHDIEVSADLPCLGLNVAAAAAAALTMQIPFEKIKRGLKEFKGVSRRFQCLLHDRLTLIDDAFNASPESVRQGLLHVKNQNPQKKLLFVLGAMLELGDESESVHAELGRWIGHEFSSDFLNHRLKIILIGEEMRSAYKILLSHSSTVQWFSHQSLAQSALKAAAANAETIYFKGSKSVGLLELIQSF